MFVIQTVSRLASQLSYVRRIRTDLLSKFSARKNIYQINMMSLLPFRTKEEILANATKSRLIEYRTLSSFC